MSIDLLTPAFRYGQRMEAQSKRHPYLFRRLARFFQDCGIKYWYWGGLICYNYKGKTVWISRPNEGYTRIIIAPVFVTYYVKAVTLVTIIKKLKKQGLL